MYVLFSNSDFGLVVLLGFRFVIVFFSGCLFLVVIVGVGVCQVYVL